MKPRRTFLCSPWMGAAFLMIGLGVLGWGLYLAVEGFRTSFWTPVPGRVVRSEVRVEKKWIPPQGTNNGGMQTSYHPDILYEYRVSGSPWTSDRIQQFKVMSNDGRAWADHATRTYWVGREVTVYFNPANPVEAVLEPGLKADHLLPAAVGIPFALVGVGILAWVRRERREARAEMMGGLVEGEDGSGRLPSGRATGSA